MRFARFQVLLISAVFILTGLLTSEAEARRGGGGFKAMGGGGFSRAGVARGGSFSSRSRQRQISAKPGKLSTGTRKPASQVKTKPQVNTGDRKDKLGDRQGDRQEAIKDRQEDRQDWADERREDRQDFIEDELDDNWDRWDDDDDFIAGVIVGGAIGAAASSSTVIYTLPCTTTAVTFNGIQYYRCSSTWYQRAYRNGEVTYIVTSPPPGY